MKLLIIITALLFSSCSIFKKVKSRHKEERKEEIHVVTDSVSKVNSDSTAVKKTEDKKEGWWSIDIDTTEASIIEITQDSTGRQTVKATGKIKKVEGKINQTVKTSDSTVKSDAQVVAVKKDEQVKRQEAYTHTEVNKTKVKFAWWWLIIPVTIYGVVKLWPRVKPFLKL